MQCRVLLLLLFNSSCAYLRVRVRVRVGQRPSDRGTRMNGLIRFSLGNWYAVVVGVLTIVVIGTLIALQIPIDILPAFKSPAVQVLTFYGGMPAINIENDITNRMERWTGQAAGQA